MKSKWVDPDDAPPLTADDIHSPKARWKIGDQEVSSEEGKAAFRIAFRSGKTRINMPLDNQVILFDNTDPAIQLDSQWTSLGNTANMTTRQNSVAQVDFIGESVSHIISYFGSSSTSTRYFRFLGRVCTNRTPPRWCYRHL